MKKKNTTTQAQGARRVEHEGDVVFEKMLLDTFILNFNHNPEGVSFNVTRSGNPFTPYTIDITCGYMEFSQSFSTYQEFNSLTDFGLGFFLGVYDENDKPDFLTETTE